MCLFPMLHGVLNGNRDRRSTLIAITASGATTTLEDSLSTASMGVLDWSLKLPQAQLLFAIDVAIVSVYVNLLLWCRPRYLSPQFAELEILPILRTEKRAS